MASSTSDLIILLTLDTASFDGLLSKFEGRMGSLVRVQYRPLPPRNGRAFFCAESCGKIELAHVISRADIHSCQMFLREEQILRRYDMHGITEYDLTGGVAQISDHL